MQSEIVLNAQAELGEGPSWDDRNMVLYWVDILRGLVHFYEPLESRDTTVSVGKYVSSVVPKRSGGVAITLQHGFCTLNPKNGKASTVAEVEKHMAGNRLNDGKSDPAGRFWAGTMDMEEKNASGGLYFLERNKVHRVLEGVTISNGLGWSPDDRTMYYIDTPTRKVSAFDYDMKSGGVKNRRTVVDFGPDQPGNPDGMAVDAEGMIWVAHWGGYRVTRWNPATGRPLNFVTLPVAHVTSCCFGGKNLDELYITTARTGLNQEELSRQPLSGGLFKVRTGFRGLPTNVFDG